MSFTSRTSEYAHLIAAGMHQIKEGDSLGMMQGRISYENHSTSQRLAQTLGVPVRECCCCCADGSECSPEALAGSSPKRILDFTAGESPAASEQAPNAAQQQEPLASNFHGSGAISLEGLRCPVTSSFSMSEQQQAAHVAALHSSDAHSEAPDSSAAPARAVDDGCAQSAAQQSSSTGLSEGERGSHRLRDDSKEHLPASASASAQPVGLQKVGLVWPFPFQSSLAYTWCAALLPLVSVRAEADDTWDARVLA